MIELHHGDCIEVMRTLPDNSVDSIVTDPPYDLKGKSGKGGFMGKEWDGTGIAFDPETWREAMRVLKPGGFLLAFGGTRTWHRLAVAVEDAGFDIKDSLAWVFGSGFPKHRASLKPAFEPVVMARKPYEGSLAANEAIYGTGALNIDACRIAGTEDSDRGNRRSSSADPDGLTDAGTFAIRARSVEEKPRHSGRWPANVALDEHMAAVLDAQSGDLGKITGGTVGAKSAGIFGAKSAMNRPVIQYAETTGGASRFFKVAEADEQGAISQHFPREFDAPFMYSPKAPKKERPIVDGVAHATVKPLALMRWLVRLVTPEGGTVLEPFAGSGTTVEACILEGFHCIAIEREAEYLPLIQARIDRQDAA